MMAPYVKAGERLYDSAGAYLATAACNIGDGNERWHSGMFSHSAMNLAGALTRDEFAFRERLTGALVARIRHVA